MSRYDGLIIPRSYNEYINKSDPRTLAQALQQNNVLSEAVAAGDNKAVKSGAVATALAGKQDTLTFDDAPTANSNNPVKSGGIYQVIQDTVSYDVYNYPATEWAPGMTSIDVTSIMSSKEKTGYNKFPIAYSLSQNYLQVSFSPIQDGNYYMNVYNGYTGLLVSSIEIDFIYIKHRYLDIITPPRNPQKK